MSPEENQDNIEVVSIAALRESRSMLRQLDERVARATPAARQGTTVCQRRSSSRSDRRDAVCLDSRPIILTRKEHALLSLLVRNAGEIVPRDALLWRIWGYSAQIRTRTLDVHIRRLRRKLGNHSDQYIETIFRSSYRFRPFRPEPPLRDYDTVSALTPRPAPLWEYVE